MLQHSMRNRSASANDLQESGLAGVSRRMSGLETNTVHMTATVSLQCPSGPLAYHATGPVPRNHSWSEGSDISPTSGVTSHGIYSADTQSGANTINGLGRHLYGSRQLGSRKRGLCESFISDPTGGAAAQPCNAPQILDNDDDDGNDTDDNTMQADKKKARKPHLLGRFSGRLETKEDEKRLQEECKQLGPLLGGSGKRGEKSRLTLAKIVRGIASGEVREHCEQREAEMQRLRQDVNSISSLRNENAQLKDEVERLRREITDMKRIRTLHQAQAVSHKMQQNMGLSRLKPPLAPQRNLAPSTATITPIQQSLSIQTDEPMQGGLSSYILPHGPVGVDTSTLPSVVGMPPNAVLPSTVLVPAQPVVAPAVLSLTGPNPMGDMGHPGAAGSGSTLQLGTGSTLSRQGSVSSQLNCLPTAGPRANVQQGIPGIPSAAPGAGPGQLAVDASLLPDLGTALPDHVTQELMAQQLMEQADTIRESGQSYPNPELTAHMFEKKAESLSKAAQSQKCHAEAVTHHQAEMLAMERAKAASNSIRDMTCHGDDTGTVLAQPSLGPTASDDGEVHTLLPQLDLLQEMEVNDAKADPASIQRHQLIVEVQAAMNDAEEHKRAKNAASYQAQCLAADSRDLDRQALRLQEAISGQPVHPFVPGPAPGVLIPTEQVAGVGHGVQSSSVISPGQVQVGYQGALMVGQVQLMPQQHVLPANLAPIDMGLPMPPPLFGDQDQHVDHLSRIPMFPGDGVLQSDRFPSILDHGCLQPVVSLQHGGDGVGHGVLPNPPFA
eukprot:jgi/Botrbrau1/13738/Bobra.0356s0014.1